MNERSYIIIYFKEKSRVIDVAMDALSIEERIF